MSFSFGSQKPPREVSTRQYVDGLRALLVERYHRCTRTREFTTDSFTKSNLYTYGPFNALIEPFKLDPATQVFDEKGSTVELKFLMVVVDLPVVVEEIPGFTWPLFYIGDTISDGENTWRVSSHPYREGSALQVVITLQGPELVLTPVV